MGWDAPRGCMWGRGSMSWMEEDEGWREWAAPEECDEKEEEEEVDDKDKVELRWCDWRRDSMGRAVEIAFGGVALRKCSGGGNGLRDWVRTRRGTTGKAACVEGWPRGTEVEASEGASKDDD